MRIIVTTCDRYAHILPTFAKAFVRAWPDCPWPVHILWMTADLSRGQTRLGPIVDQWGIWRLQDRGWAATFLNFLGNSTEPFLLLMEDYILDAVDPALLQACDLLMDAISDVGMIRVHPVPGPTLPWNNGHGPIGLIDNAEPYAISLQPAIWRPEVCRDLFDPAEDVWRTEINGSVRALDYRRYIFLGTKESACGYRGLMRRGLVDPDTRAWVAANLK